MLIVYWREIVNRLDSLANCLLLFIMRVFSHSWPKPTETTNLWQSLSKSIFHYKFIMNNTCLESQHECRFCPYWKKMYFHCADTHFQGLWHYSRHLFKSRAILLLTIWLRLNAIPLKMSQECWTGNILPLNYYRFWDPKNNFESRFFYDIKIFYSMIYIDLQFEQRKTVFI